MTLVDQPGPGVVEVTVWSLQMQQPHELRPAGPPKVPVELVHVETPVPELNRFLYAAVGGDWYWVDRLGWTWEQWRHWVDRPEHETWLAQVGGAPAGYLELERQADGDVEIAYFGLLPKFFGLGIGGWLLAKGIERAWSMPGTRRVWVHTCSLDGPTAKANYEARGLVLFATETELRDVSSPPPGPWPGADRPRS
jgi:GNAT superfamily N-acetyltransferase